MAETDYQLVNGKAVTNRKVGENPFAGTQYAELWENNPYAYIYYEPTFWDNIGLSSKAKDANSEYQKLYNEYVAGIYDQQRQDQYNSEAAQAARQRAAGINPDLNGVESSETSGVTPPAAAPNPALTGQSPAITAFNTITSVLGFATSALQQIHSIKGLSIANDTAESGLFDSFVQRAHPLIIQEYANRFSNKDGNKWQNWSDVSGVFEQQFNSRRQRKMASEAFKYALASSRYGAAQEAYGKMSADDLAMKHFINGMVDYTIEAQKHGFKSQIAESKYKTKYYDTLDGVTAGNAQNRENNNRGWLDKWRNKFYETLYDDFSRRGSHLAGLLLIGAGSVSPASIFAAGTNQMDRNITDGILNFISKLK